MNLFRWEIMTLFLLFLVCGASFDAVTAQEAVNDRNLARSGGGGSKTSSGGGSKWGSSSSGSYTGSSSGGGGSSRGSSTRRPADGNYLNGGLGNQYRSDTGTTIPTIQARGSCCTYLCCSSGYYRGYRRYWYRGYRPTEDEGLALEESFANASVALQELTLFNETTSLYTGDCALLVEDHATIVDQRVLVNRSVANEQTLANSTNATVHAHLTDLVHRIQHDFDWDTEVDLSLDIRTWFLDYNALQPCLNELSAVSTQHDEHVDQVRQQVQTAEDIANVWEERLASSSLRAVLSFVTTIVVVGIGMSSWMM